MQPSVAAADPQLLQQQQHHQHQQQHQWMAMQYPTPPAAAVAAPAMMMPQHYMPRHFMPFPHLQHHPHHNQTQTTTTTSSDDNNSNNNKTIWIGDLHFWMDENYLSSCFAQTGELVSIKVIRNKQTGNSEGYGFVEFQSRAGAENVLQSYNGTIMPNTDQVFRLNWASFSMGDKRSNGGAECSIFVGDLASDVTDTLLQETFASQYLSVKGAKVVIDANTGRSKGYGFVRFGDENERIRAMDEMNGAYCSSRPMRIGIATPRKSSGYPQSQGGFASNGSSSQGDSDLSNTTIFVGGLDSNTSDQDLRQVFSLYGEVLSVKIPAGKGCGFVQFAQRNNAEDALQNLNGTVIGKQSIRLSWGRNPANKQTRADPNDQWNGTYYGAPTYDGYGYAVPPQDPNMYTAAYGAYPVYGNQQQVS